jgi:hypothetical protein
LIRTMRASIGGRNVGRRLVTATLTALSLHAAPALAQAPAEPVATEPAAPSANDVRETCLANHEQAQVRRIEKKLVDARTAARSCAVTACPAAVRSDCSEWVAELSKLIPTLVLVAESGSGELETVRVTLDGALLTESLDGTAIEIEPGPHVLRFEYESEPPIERRIDVPEGEKSLMVRVRFAGDAPPVPVAVAPIAAPVTPKPRDPGPRPVPLLTYVLGGVALAAAGTSAVVAAGAFSERSKANDECAPNCDEARVDSIHDRFLLADIAGGVAIASAGLAVVFYVTRPEVPNEAARPGFSPFLTLNRRRSGVELSAGGTF